MAKKKRAAAPEVKGRDGGEITVKALFARHRIKICVFMVVALSVWANLELLGTKFGAYQRPTAATDPLMFHVERYARARDLVAPYKAVGYITTVSFNDAIAREREKGDLEYLGQYYAAQYSLAPTALFYGPDFPLVVGNFLESPPDPALLDGYGLRIERIIQPGIFILKKASK